jgi:extradiol dioxygenase family protein
VDFDFFGHQIVAHLSAEGREDKAHNKVDGEQVPVRHFGVILSMTEWRRLADKLSRDKVPFIIAPDIRFEGEPGEQATFFIEDPSGNALEFKAFEDESRIFAK